MATALSAVVTGLTVLLLGGLARFGWLFAEEIERRFLHVRKMTRDQGTASDGARYEWITDQRGRVVAAWRLPDEGEPSR